MNRSPGTSAGLWKIDRRIRRQPQGRGQHDGVLERELVVLGELEGLVEGTQTVGPTVPDLGERDLVTHEQRHNNGRAHRVLSVSRGQSLLRHGQRSPESRFWSSVERPGRALGQLRLRRRIDRVAVPLGRRRTELALHHPGHEPGRNRSAPLAHEAVDDQRESLGSRPASPADSNRGLAVIIRRRHVVRSGVHEHDRPYLALSGRYDIES
jgi:hypothetical protein